MQLRHALSAGLLVTALGLAQAAGGCALVVGADFSDRELRACAPCATGVPGACAQGCMSGDVCVSEVAPALENCETEDIDESCDGAAACDGQVVFATSFGDGSNQENTRAVVDSAGNIILAVAAEGEVNYGGGKLTGSGAKDLHVVKLNPEGRHVWSFAFSGGVDHDLGGLAVDAGDNILISGAYAGQIQFGDMVHAGAGDNLADTFVAKLDPDGAPVWSKGYIGPVNDASARLAVDGAGNTIVVGRFDDTFTMGTTLLMSVGSLDVFLAKLDPDGELLWACSVGGPSEDFIYDVAVGPGGEIVITGAFTGNINIGGSDVVGDIDSPNAFIAALGESCAYVWHHAIVSSFNTEGRAVTIDAQGRVLATGYFDSTADFGGMELTATGAPDAYLAAYRLSDGALLWARGFGDDATQVGGDVAVDPAGDVILVGHIEGQADFGSGDPLVADGIDPFVVKFTPSTDGDLGAFRWNQLFTGAGTQFPLSVATDALGNIVIAGAMHDLISIGGTVLDHDGAGDVWIAKLRP